MIRAACLTLALTLCACAPVKVHHQRSASVTGYDPVIDRAPWTLGARTGRVITTPNFRVFTTETEPLFLSRIPAFLELSLAFARREFGDLPEPDRRLDTYLLSNRGEWESLTRDLTGERAAIYLRIQAGGFSERGRALLFDVGRRGTFGLASHEAWHQYTQTSFEQPLPLWLEEGIASTLEGYRWSTTDASLPVFLPWANVDRFDRLREVVDAGRAAPLDQLLSSRPQDLLSWHSNESALDYYAQVWALVLFLRESGHAGYAEGARRLVEDSARGRMAARLAQERGTRAVSAFAARRVGADLFEVYIDADLARADGRFQQFMWQATRPGARDAVVAGRSPLSR